MREPAFLLAIDAALRRLAEPRSPQSMTVADVAKLLGCSPRTARRLIRTRARGRARQVGGSWVIDARELAVVLAGIWQEHRGEAQLAAVDRAFGLRPQERVQPATTPAARDQVLSERVLLVPAGARDEVAGPGLFVKAATLKELLVAVTALHDQHAGGARQRAFEARLQGRPQ